MALVKLDIAADIVKAVDEVGLTAHGAEMIDVIIDELGNINRRPGIVTLADLGTSAAIDGLFWWEAQDYVLAVSAGRLFKITDTAGTVTEITITAGAFESGSRVSFADYGTAVYAANGGKIFKIVHGGNTIFMADADAPTAVKTVAFLDQRLLANEVGSRKCHYSNVNAPDTWDANYISKEAQPDNLKALAVKNLELYLLGEKTLEPWVTDASTDFRRLDQGFTERGTVADATFRYCDADSTFYWLDNNRHVVKLSGRTAIPVSLTMTKFIQGFSTVTDATGDYLEIGGRPYYILSFPTEGYCLVYDFTKASWYRWGYWNSGTSAHDRFRGNCFCLAPAWNYVLAGDRANGKVYRFSPTAYDDAEDDLVSLIRTAHYNHGSEAVRKFSHALYFRLKRTSVVADDATPDLLVRYRDNGSTVWSSEITVSLQQVGNTEFRGRLSRLGSYYSRQWEFVLSDAYPLCLVSVEEDVEADNV